MSKNCTCNQTNGDCCFSCCSNKNFVQDQVCCEWKTTSQTGLATTRTIYINSLKCPLFASGFVKYGCGVPNTPIQVQFLINGTVVGSPITLDEGGCLTFTAARFDEIQVIIPAALLTTATFEGEICVTPRYRLN
ncbi:hypothetical protein HNQ34_002059 [Anoxybacillus tepidamans]|uniref:Endospore appendages core domain-containing protein n=1 Tax=Anoxybacteroides tepidamans TaxID=265948 RepID=A0A7W8MWT3_9BACL|nr:MULTISPECIES: S-Ena type endospore appendage [Anoxybacillus]MBB5324960.1 hypothetical protein [Anoxybacillus tepidamans]MCZ0755649.1 DUF3992 domain-containing protein [Anoxybacillus sp. J5B_2022]